MYQNKYINEMRVNRPRQTHVETNWVQNSVGASTNNQRGKDWDLIASEEVETRPVI